MVLPIFLRGSEVLSGVIQIEQARMEHARRLYFRIGALPQLGLSGVRVTVCDETRAEELIEEAARRLAEMARGKPIEIRAMRIDHRAEGRVSFAAEWVRVRPEGFWEARGVTFADETGTITAAEGTVWLAGEKAGQIELKGSDGLHIRRLTNPGSKAGLKAEFSASGL